MDIEIIPPSLATLFLNKTAKVVCKVTLKSNEGGFDKITWEDEMGTELATLSGNGKRGPFSLAHEISYGKWAAGLKRSCVVHHEQLPYPKKTPYEKKSGKQVSLSM